MKITIIPKQNTGKRFGDTISITKTGLSFPRATFDILGDKGNGYALVGYDEDKHLCIKLLDKSEKDAHRIVVFRFPIYSNSKLKSLPKGRYSFRLIDGWLVTDCIVDIK